MTAPVLVLSRLILVFFVIVGVLFVWHGIRDASRGESLDLDELQVALFYGAIAPFALGKILPLNDWIARQQQRNPGAMLVLRRTTFTTCCYLAALLMWAVACAMEFLPNQTNRMPATIGLIGIAIAAFAVLRTGITTFLSLSPSGLEYSRFKLEPIPWRDIVSSRVAGTSHMIALTLVDEERYVRNGFRAVPHWRSVFVPSRFMVSPDSFDVSPEWLRQAIQIRLDAFGRPNSPTTVQRQGTH